MVPCSTVNSVGIPCDSGAQICQKKIPPYILCTRSAATKNNYLMSQDSEAVGYADVSDKAVLGRCVGISLANPSKTDLVFHGASNIHRILSFT